MVPLLTRVRQVLKFLMIKLRCEKSTGQLFSGEKKIKVELHQIQAKYEFLRVICPREEKNILSSIAEHGQLVPVSVIRSDNPDKPFILIDGYRRLRAIKKLRRDYLESDLLEEDETEALSRWLESVSKSPRGPFEEGLALEDLHFVKGISMGELSIRFGRSKSWISRRIGLVRALPESVRRKVKEGKISPYVAAKYLVPLARANTGRSKKLLIILAKGMFTAREARVLYRGFREALKKENQRVLNLILKRPRVFLNLEETRALLEAALGEGSKEEAFISRLKRIQALVDGARKDLPGALSFDTSESKFSYMVGLLKSTERSFQSLMEEVEKEEIERRRGHDREESERGGSVPFEKGDGNKENSERAENLPQQCA